MPSKKKKYNARFPAGRIKKIMQTDEEVGKVAQAVPVIISRTLELFVESLLTKTLRITNARNAKTLSPSHMKQCIISESRFDFLRDLVKNIPDIGVNEEQLSGSETGYEPATGSTSNGGETPGTSASSSSSSVLSLQRSESYTPAGSSSSSSAAVAVNYAGILPVKASTSQPATPQPGNTLKRTLNHVGFYKEISLDETTAAGSSSSSSSREPPPKLTRLHSAPASATITTANAASSIPFKIDILPTLPAAATTSGSQQRAVPATAPASSSNYKITYKFEPASPKATATPQPVFKLDYSNVKLPQTGQGTPPAPQQQQQSTSATRHHPLQPTIKIDLSSITNYNHNNNNNQPSPGSVVVVKQQVPSAAAAANATTPLTPLSAASSSSSSSSGVSSGSSRNPYVFSSGGAASSSSSSATAATPAYSSVVSSSAIPGMDEDYDDI